MGARSEAYFAGYAQQPPSQPDEELDEVLDVELPDELYVFVVLVLMDWGGTDLFSPVACALVA